MPKKIVVFFIICSAFFAGCKDDVVPKPASHLRLDYPVAKYFPFDTDCPFTFAVNEDAIVEKKSTCDLTIKYPKMKATIFLSYKTVNGDIKFLLRDAQKLTYEHVIKADDIIEQPFVNKSEKAFGMFYEVNGNAATNTQFYVTDSTRHFLTASVYFYAKPNFDSVMPAANYLQNDMRRIMETIRWK